MPEGLHSSTRQFDWAQRLEKGATNSLYEFLSERVLQDNIVGLINVSSWLYIFAKNFYLPREGSL